MSTYEPLVSEVPLSRTEILDDIFGGLAESLSKDCRFDWSSAWLGYRASISISLDLIDIDHLHLEHTVKMGEPSPDAPVVLVKVNAKNPSEARKRIGTEEPSLEEGRKTPTERRRWYAPRQRRS